MIVTLMFAQAGYLTVYFALSPAAGRLRAQGRHPPRPCPA
jgi:hypothetical protein